jgi:phosphate:Na+ symporter
MNDIHTVSRLLHAIGDFERIGDHALNLQETAQEIRDKDIHFSAAGDAEIRILVDALKDILDKTLVCFTANEDTAARKVEPLEETIDRLIEEVRMRHIQRLQSGECTIQLGFVLSDLLTNFERVSDHCSNIAVSVLEEHDASLDRHAYMEDLKDNDEFNTRLSKALNKYQLPNA